MLLPIVLGVAGDRPPQARTVGDLAVFGEQAQRSDHQMHIALDKDVECLALLVGDLRLGEKQITSSAPSAWILRSPLNGLGRRATREGHTVATSTTGKPMFRRRSSTQARIRCSVCGLD